MAKHVGIVGCSVPGSALCYSAFCEYASERMGNYQHPQVTLSTISMATYLPHFEPLNRLGIAELLLTSTRLLADAGAQLAICPDNSVHLAFDEVAKRSPIPWLHIARVVEEEARRRGFARLGVLGTRFTMGHGLYGGAVVPDAEDQKVVDEIIFRELVHDVVRDESRAKYAEVIGRLAAKGCDAVVLGCTEIPLLISDEESPLPTLDSTRLLAKAAVQYALAS